jgi:hypothetical protein
MVDAVVPTGDETHPSKVMDILMMVPSDGRERREEEFRGLFRPARLRPTWSRRHSVLSIVEGERD